jgi:hypothetical protein
MFKISNASYVLFLWLTMSFTLSATIRSVGDLNAALLKAHTNAFGNKENALTQRLTYDEKQFWLKTISEVQEFIAAIQTEKGFLPSKEKIAQQGSKKILMASMERFVRINNDLLNTIASSYGIIALGLPINKKANGSRSFNDINAKAIDLKVLSTMIEPLKAHKDNVIQVQNEMKQMPKTQNQQLKNGVELVERLGLLLETTIQFTLNSFNKLSGYVLAHTQTAS